MAAEMRRLEQSDLEQAWDLDHLAFNTRRAYREGFLDCAIPERMLGLFADARLVATVADLPLPQYWGGRRVEMGGLSSVAVAPDARGRGLASRLVRAALDEMRERGEVVSALFPATTSLYRRLGWELAGAHVVRRIVPSRLLSLARPREGSIRPARREDLPEIRACYTRVARGQNGLLTRDHPEDRSRWYPLDRGFDHHRVYVALGSEGEIEGYLAYHYDEKHPDAFENRIRVRELFAETRNATEGLWWLLGSSASVAELITYPSSPEDPLLLLQREQVERVHGDIRWMLRIVDAAGAVQQRGFPQGLELRVSLSLDDALVPDNCGAYTLLVEKGEGVLEPAGRGTHAAGKLEMEIGAFASLYSGWASTATLARLDMLRGGSSEERSLLDAAFASQTAWLPEEF